LADIIAQPAALRTVLTEVLREDAAPLRRGADLLGSARRLILTSMGSAYYSLQPVAEALDALHDNVRLVETSEVLRRRVRPGDAYLVMSRSGESREVKALVERLAGGGHDLMAITMTPESTLARSATLTIHDPAPYDGFICTKAYTSMAMIGLLIASLMGRSLDDSLIAGLHEALQWMDNSYEALYEQISMVPWLGESVTFLSRSTGMAAAASGALWFEEAARVRAGLSSSDNFMHGPVEQVDAEFKGVWVDLDPDAVAEGHLQDLRAKGAQMVGLVSDRAYACDIDLPSFDLPPVYRVLTAALPLQLFAYLSALARGLDPGEMRYLDWIVQ
jgi:glucosamine--fructose-6-phosphate aminotransferase (isomerizing)